MLLCKHYNDDTVGSNVRSPPHGQYRKKAQKAVKTQQRRQLKEKGKEKTEKKQTKQNRNNYLTFDNSTS